MFRRIVRSRVSLTVLLVLGVSSVSANDFRVETDIFCNGEKEPSVQYLTIFRGDAVYDFRVSPEEITLFDVHRNKIVLMDPSRNAKVTLTPEETIHFAASMKSHVDELNPLFFFACNPAFDTALDTKGEALTLSSKHLTYRIKGSKPKQPEAVRRYQEFADWSSRLNAMQPGGLPPFARIEANRAVAEKGWLPEEVERTVTTGTLLNQRKLELRTRHLANWILSETDEKKIARAGELLVTLKEIPFTEYRDPQKTTANKQAKR